MTQVRYCMKTEDTAGLINFLSGCRNDGQVTRMLQAAAKQKPTHHELLLRANT